MPLCRLASRRHVHGQALLLIALALGLLVALIVGVNDVALRRRTQTRVQDSLDQAAAAAVVQITPASLVSDAPMLLPREAEAHFRAVLRAGLMRVAATIDPDPATVAQQAHIQILQAGGRCQGRTLTAPAICAEITVTIAGALGAHPMTFTTLAQATHQP